MIITSRQNPLIVRLAKLADRKYRKTEGLFLAEGVKLSEEAAKSGITDVLIITGRNKGSIEDYFDYSPEYESYFTAKNREEEIEKIRATAEPK